MARQRRSWRAGVLALLTVVGSGVRGQDTAPADPSGDVVVNGVRDIVVNGRARRCRPVPGDPLGRVRLPTDRLRGSSRQSVVAVTGPGRFLLVPDDEPVTGPVVWQRAGRGLDQYVFGVPTDGRPLCIGTDAADRGSFGQLRRIVEARPFHGHRIRFTAWVASGDAGSVRFWLGAGRGQSVLAAGGNTNNRSWGGDHGWTPVMIEAGPVGRVADHISYGFLLGGHGSVWVYKPELSIVPDGEPNPRKGDVSVFGRSES